MLANVKFLRSFVVLALLSPLAAFAATPITGTVTNRTTGKPSAGDDVTLIRLAAGMQESTKTKTDARGHYSLDVPDDGLHLVRVTHDKANYFQPAQPGTTTVDLDVYNAAASVKGVSTEAIVMRLQTDASGNSLKVVENFFVKNDSKPAMTQFSNEPFDFYLPEGAVVEGSAALAPGGMPVQAAPVPLADKGKYTFLFPIRPGETRFQVSYHVPYSGTFKFDPHVTAMTDTVAVMMPKSMTFTPAAGSPFSAVNDEVNAQTFVARSVAVGQPLAFTLTGKGELPRDSQDPAQNGQGGQAGAAGAQSGGSQAATDNTAPGKGLDNPLDPENSRDPWGKYKWWILSGLALILAVAAALLLKKPAATTGAGALGTPASPVLVSSPLVHASQLLTVLKEEMFALETDKLQGKVSDAEYAETKAALELILRRALKKSA
ncbi:carboxypeptidase-like regulatory domain-containing protein [Granulicella paludicola]|uniref:carboxypeptidase-like regulatory domain-containing protein n=1 Tax=Granulicella paludicola TaxID=474951 RepID=UPI0021E076AC|nr:carboxypeptidase-like regulatory domain-containing protein [Granulicella paludicola]